MALNTVVSVYIECYVTFHLVLAYVYTTGYVCRTYVTQGCD